MTNIEISREDDLSLFRLGTRMYYSAQVQMESFWSHIIQRKNTSDNMLSQERIFMIKPVDRLLRMTYVANTDTIYCKLENTRGDIYGTK